MLFEMIIYFFVFLINSLLNFIKFAFNEGKSLVKYPLILSIINNLEKVLSKLLLSSINSRIKKAKSFEKQNNYKFIC